ncbi:MAG: VCBS repeat-containing protein [Bacteroidota bacterium]
MRVTHPSLHITLLVLLLFASACSNPSAPPATLFQSIGADASGISFTNELKETLTNNYYQYMYTYIGGGVASADFDNDGKVDLFFTANTTQNRLYKNLGDFKFEDVTSASGITYIEGFNAGVSVVDINQDGYLDLYICRGGAKNVNGSFKNLLYINNGDLTFTESAEQYGLADENRGIQASFFDYDLDNDLDVYISNTPDITAKTSIVNMDSLQRVPATMATFGCDRLYENDGTDHFTDVSQKAGLLYDVGFGLNAQVGDLNGDGWPDIYVCNDFKSPDLVYLNNGDKTFTESRNQLFRHISYNSMGGEIVDINNDGAMDVITLDMNPEDYIRSKTTMTMTSIDKFQKMVTNGYHYQYMHNMLQLNNGEGHFSEIGNLSGIANTDWSWSVLSADFDLDGLNDVFVTNGVYRDVLDQDTNRKILYLLKKNGRKPTKADFLRYVQLFPQQKLPNYFFRNKGDLTFENTSFSWSDTLQTFSNGAVYTDLDNDGDLDVVVSNINDPATLLKNTAIENNQGRSLQVQLSGPKGNLHGVGASVRLELTDGTQQTKQLINTWGFLSSVSNTLHFGLKTTDLIQKLTVIWPDRKMQALETLPSGKVVRFSYENAVKMDPPAPIEPLLTRISLGPKHEEIPYSDFEKQVLLPHKLSQTGPAVAVGDVNNDGLEDFYLGGAHQKPGKVYVGTKNGTLLATEQPALLQDATHEDVGALFVDVNNDSYPDLYVVSGSYEFEAGDPMLQDRLYLNDGNGKLIRNPKALPEMFEAGSVVAAADYDLDGDQDLFVGGRVIPGKYPYPPRSYLLENAGGVFKDITDAKAEGIKWKGMITDAKWVRLNGTDYPDLVLAGEWMGIEVMRNREGTLMPDETYASLSSQVGWWNRLLVTDLDDDGDLDMVAGNLGLNSKFHASKDQPFRVYTRDFDSNGTEDVFLVKYYKGKEVPVRGKTCSVQQIPALDGIVSSYNQFASMDIHRLLGSGIENALQYEVTEFRSGIFRNNGDGDFQFEPFENSLQRSPITGIVFQDLDGDGSKDLLLAGNNYHTEVETTRSDAGVGHFLKGNGNGFDYVASRVSGFHANGDVRNLVAFTKGGDLGVLVVQNNQELEFYTKRLTNKQTAFSSGAM